MIFFLLVQDKITTAFAAIKLNPQIYCCQHGAAGVSASAFPFVIHTTCYPIGPAATVAQNWLPDTHIETQTRIS